MKGTPFSADTKAITSCRSAENDRATSCFSWPLTTSPKDMVFLVSPSLFSLPKTLAPYSWISNGGCESCEDRLYFQIHHKNGIKFEMNYTSEVHKLVLPNSVQFSASMLKLEQPIQFVSQFQLG